MKKGSGTLERTQKSHVFSVWVTPKSPELVSPRGRGDLSIYLTVTQMGSHVAGAGLELCC